MCRGKAADDGRASTVAGPLAATNSFACCAERTSRVMICKHAATIAGGSFSFSALIASAAAVATTAKGGAAEAAAAAAAAAAAVLSACFERPPLDDEGALGNPAQFRTASSVRRTLDAVSGLRSTVNAGSTKSLVASVVGVFTASAAALAAFWSKGFGDFDESFDSAVAGSFISASAAAAEDVLVDDADEE